MTVRPRGAWKPGGGKENQAMANSSAPGEKHAGTSAHDDTAPRVHSENPAEGSDGEDLSEIRTHSQDPAEGPEDEN